MSYEHYLPSCVERSRLAAAIGLVSDTHMPQRRRALPANLGEVLGGVDFLLHAGDVGELWVLDQLSAIAPVIAVHGNDDTEDAQRELPFQQLVVIAGQRILLWHSHYPDWQAEMESRKDDALRPKFQRSINQAKGAGANLVIFGHWHIPLVYQAEGITLVNPGALASGNEFTRQLRNTVALLLIEKSGASYIVHVDLAAPDAPYVPQIDWDAGFNVAAGDYSKSIVAPDLAPAIYFMRQHFSREELLAIRPLIAAKAIPIWEREGGELTLADVEDVILQDTTLPRDLHTRVLKALHTWQNIRQTS
jgi:putative phosphoesterase